MGGDPGQLAIEAKAVIAYCSTDTGLPGAACSVLLPAASQGAC
jgi:hypothetical protein